MHQFQKFSPRDFEAYVGAILTKFGWQVSLTPSTRDGGVDIVGVTKDPTGLETTWAIECKKYDSGQKVGTHTIHNLIGVREALGFDKAVVITSGGVTEDARRIADIVHGIHVVDGSQLDSWLLSVGSRPGELPPSKEPKAFSSCFVSHSTADREFASFLVMKLRESAVRVWYAADNLQAGQKVVDQVDEAISTFDRLIVVLSKSSIASAWVETEVRKAWRRQKEEGHAILFPVSLMPFDQLLQWELVDADTGADIAVELRSFYIPNFSDWKHADHFDEQFERLLEGLRASDPSPEDHLELSDDVKAKLDRSRSEIAAGDYTTRRAEAE